MIYTNTEQYGNKLLDVLDAEFESAKDVTIASGYTSLDIIQRYNDEFIRIAKLGGQSRLLVGMAFYEGLSQRKLDMLNTLSTELQKTAEGNGVYVCYVRKYHGKLYKFDDSRTKKIYIGSSNFSRSGLSENIEATVPLTNDDEVDNASSFLDYLFSEDNSTHINKADIVVPGSSAYKKRVSLDTLSDLERYDPDSIDISNLTYFDYSLSRVAKSEKSSLNVYFGKGRWSRSTGKVVPRDWYEVELIAQNSLSKQEIYPKGDFTAYTDDGYVIPMRTSGDYYKNIRSKGNLRLLGMWIKKKLQDSGSLVTLTPVTQDTFDQYGKDSIKFYKITDSKYYLEF